MTTPIILTLPFFFAGVVQLRTVRPRTPVIHPITGSTKEISAILTFRE
ncbi:hypothetical protein [Cutibacterium acnes]|nr:hypothetical protein [Cutibacterium acnes]MCD1051237.1 hypothetical protein [Cutibacterium acnes]